MRMLLPVACSTLSVSQDESRIFWIFSFATVQRFQSFGYPKTLGIRVLGIRVSPKLGDNQITVKSFQSLAFISRCFWNTAWLSRCRSTGLTNLFHNRIKTVDSWCKTSGKGNEAGFRVMFQVALLNISAPRHFFIGFPFLHPPPPPGGGSFWCLTCFSRSFFLTP